MIYGQSDHIKRIIENQLSQSSKPILAVAKGFGIEVIKALGKELETVSDWSKLISLNSILIPELQKNSIGLLPSIFQLDTSQIKCRILLFEELLLLLNNVKGLSVFNSFNFLIIENDLFDEIKNPSSLDLDDFENLLDNSVNSQFANDDINIFYAFGQRRDEHIMVKYFEPEFEEDDNCLVLKLSSIKPEITRQSPSNKLQNLEIEYPLKIDDQLDFERNEWHLSDKITWIIPKEIVERIDLNSHFNRLNDFLNALGIVTEVNPTVQEEKEDEREEFTRILNTYWKSNTFRELTFYRTPGVNNEKYQISQAVIIEEVVNQAERGQKTGNSRDIFVTAPTGAGKSVLFQVPAIYLADQYNLVSIILSPLKALMEDQVSALKKRGYHGSAFLNSDQTILERESILNDIQSGKISLLYLSPELLMSYSIDHFLGDRNLGFFVIDEAHLVTTWGRDFRVDYWFLGTYIKNLRKNSDTSFPILAVTATAPYNGDNDLVFETIESLNMHQPIIKIGNVRRDDIKFEIRRLKSSGNHEEQKVDKTSMRIKEFVDAHIKSIVYCPWRSQVDIIVRAVDEATSKSIGRYFSTVPANERHEVVDGLKSGNIKSVLATKAFGMGIDIDDISVVYHHAVNGGLPDYVQEIGRAARRSDLIGRAVTDYERRDLKFFKILFGLSSIKNYQVRLVIEKLYKLYLKNKNSKKFKRANLLVSTEDFIQIFGGDASGASSTDDTKVKSALLLIEREFLNRYPYPVIIVRPKLLFSSVYGMVKGENYERFEKSIGKYCDFIRNSKQNSDNKIYEIRLNEIWEEKFQELSFPMAKRMFFQKELFDQDGFEISPKFKIVINIEVELSNLLDRLEFLRSKITLGLIALSGRFFLRKEFILKLQNLGLSKQIAERTVDIYLALFCKKTDSRVDQSDRFMQEKRIEHESQYRILNNGYNQLHQSLMDDVIRYFTSQGNSSKTFFTDITPERSRRKLKLAYLLEAFQLGSYSFEGGKLPMLFIRINDPLKLFREYNKLDKYSNKLILDVQKKHKYNVGIMEYFFESEMSDEQRWDFIEDYFLGREVLPNAD